MPQAAALPLALGRFLRPGVPKYVALRDALLQAVSSGTLGAGSRLPNEAELAAMLPLSLGTIQRALRALVDDGVIVRRQGQGTFVAERAGGRMHAPLHCRFLDDSQADYLPVYPVVTARYAEQRDGPWTPHLGTRPTLCIERVLGIADEFKVFSRFYVDSGRMPAFASLPAKKLSGENFKEIIWRESGLPIGRIAQFLSRLRLPQAIGRAIGVSTGVAGQRLEIYAFAGKESPLYYQELYIPPNGRRLHLAADGRDPGFAASA
ncbi:MAG: GntR family transcriptional regulator [Burkholderiales bacterium]